MRKEMEAAPAGRPTPGVALYVASIMSLGAAVLAVVVRSEGATWAAAKPVRLVVLMVACVVAELTPLRFPRGNESEQITFSATFGLAVAIGWGALPAMLAMAGGAVAAGIVLGRTWWKIGFNAAQFTAAIASAAWVVDAAAGSRPPGVLPPSDSLHAMLAGGAVFVVMNGVLVATALALAQRMPLVLMIRQAFGFQFATAASVASLAPLVLVLVDWSPLLVPILGIPLLAVYQGGRAAGDKRRSEDRFLAMAQNAVELVVIVDEHGRITYASGSAAQILGFRESALTGEDFLSFVEPADRPRATAVVSDIIGQQGKVTTVELLMRTANGPGRYFELVWNNLLANHSVRGIVINGRDVTERRVLEGELAHQAFHDPLTNLANRALFRNRVEQAVARASRASNPIAVMFLDLDNFKTINDSLGHAAGDLVLVEAGRRVSSCLRAGDTAARLGGDEFGILLEPAEGTEEVAARILEALVPPFGVQGKEVSVRASIGIEIATESTETAEEILRNADVAMYAAKTQGKGRFQLFEPSMHASALERLEVEADLQHAFDHDELFLHYQPIVRLTDGGLVGVEALVRWQHPRRGLVSPAGIIPIAEETGQILRLGRWVLAQAARQIGAWRSAHPDADIRVAVNVSATQLDREDFVADVAMILQGTGAAPSSVVLELTESALMRDPEASSAKLSALKELGVRVALDDFGTGYSSLSYLNHFPIDVLKIDREFVHKLALGPEDSALAKAIVQIGRTLKLETVAEGIEDGASVERLRALGCELGQGFFLSHPVPAEEIDAMLAAGGVIAGVQAGGSRSRSAQTVVSR